MVFNVLAGASGLKAFWACCPRAHGVSVGTNAALILGGRGRLASR